MSDMRIRLNPRPLMSVVSAVAFVILIAFGQWQWGRYEDKRLLQAASVIGKDVPFALLLAIAELGEEDLRRGLAHLQAAELLYETALC